MTNTNTMTAIDKEFTKLLSVEGGIERTILGAILKSKNPDKAVQLFASIVEKIAREYDREQETMTSEYKKEA